MFLSLILVKYVLGYVYVLLLLYIMFLEIFSQSVSLTYIDSIEIVDFNILTLIAKSMFLTDLTRFKFSIDLLLTLQLSLKVLYVYLI